MSHVISGVMDFKFTKFVHPVEGSSPLVKRPLRYSNLFRNARVPNKGKSANLAPKSITMTTSLELSEKRDQINDIQSNT